MRKKIQISANWSLADNTNSWASEDTIDNLIMPWLISNLTFRADLRTTMSPAGWIHGSPSTWPQNSLIFIWLTVTNFSPEPGRRCSCGSWYDFLAQSELLLWAHSESGPGEQHLNKLPFYLDDGFLWSQLQGTEVTIGNFIGSKMIVFVESKADKEIFKGESKANKLSIE